MQLVDLRELLGLANLRDRLMVDFSSSHEIYENQSESRINNRIQTVFCRSLGSRS